MTVLHDARRYHDIVRLLWRFGDSRLLKQAGLEQALVEEQMQAEAGGEAPGPEDEGDLAAALCALGPTFVKFGQMLSGRPDLLPQAWMESLADLQDKVPPVPYAEIAQVVEAEFGVPLKSIYAEFDPEPVAAASLGQVHFATLRDGTPVAVKVQRPGIRQQILDDLSTFDTLAQALDAHSDVGRRIAFADLLAQSRVALLRELDYLQEAQNLETLRGLLEDYRHLEVPRAHWDYCRTRVLTMQRIDGVKVSQAGLRKLETPLEEVVSDFYRSYLDQVLVHGFCHADPHPGNVLLTREHRLALIDLGMVVHVDPALREQLLRLLLAIAEGEGALVAELAIGICHPLEDFDREHYEAEVADLVSRFRHAPEARLREGRVLTELIRIGSRRGLRPAAELTVLGKTLMHLDQVVQALLPDFDTLALLRKHAESLVRQRTLQSLAPGAVLKDLLDVQELGRRAPGRINQILKQLARNELGIRVQAIDEQALLLQLQKIANRVTAGVVIAALIVGAALVMGVDTPQRWWGYPPLALLLFLLAAGSGFALLWNIWRNDRRR